MTGVADVVRHEMLLVVEVQPCGLQLVRAWRTLVQFACLTQLCQPRGDLTLPIGGSSHIRPAGIRSGAGERRR